MKLQLNDFHKVAADENSTTLKHPEFNHEIKIAHKHLSPKFRSQIESMPMKMADGGPTGTWDSTGYGGGSSATKSPSGPSGTQIALKSMRDAFNKAHGGPVRYMPDGGDVLPQDPEPTATPAPQQDMDAIQASSAPAPAPTPEDAGQQAYQQRLEFDKKMNPGQPPQMMQEDALNVGLNAKQGVVNKQTYDQYSQDMDKKSQLAEIEATNAKKKALGIPADPIPQELQQQNQPASSVTNTAAMPNGPSDGNIQVPGQSDPYGMNQYQKTMGEGYGDVLGGMQAQQQAESAEGKAQAVAQQQGLQQQQTLGALYQDHMRDIEAERSNLMDDVKNGHINPNQFWEDKSVPSKISTVLGLILGGMGGGIMHQENPALKMLNQQIENNINAQRLNLGNKQSLLNANRQRFQDENSAAQATRLNLADQINSQMQLAAAKAKDPVAKARLLQNAGQFMMQYAPGANQLAMKQAMLSGTRSGQVDPSMAVNAIITNPTEKEAALKEVGTAQQMEKLRSDVEGQAEHLSNQTLAGALHPSDRKSAMNSFAGILAKLSEGRFNMEESVNQMNALLPAPGDLPSTLANKAMRRQQFFDAQINTPTLNQWGIKVPKMVQLRKRPPVMGR